MRRSLGVSSTSGSGSSARRSSSSLGVTKRRGNKIKSRQTQKIGRSRTRTRTSKKNQVIKSPVSGQSNSLTVLQFRPMPLIKTFKNIFEPFTYDRVDGWGVTVAEGQQGSLVGPYNFQGGNSVSALNTSIGYMADKASEFINTTAGAIVDDKFTSFQSSRKIILCSTSNVTEMQNAGPTTLTLTIYDLMSKQTLTNKTDPTTDWSTGLTSTKLFDSNSATTPYTGPTASKNFNLHWKIIKKQTVELGSGRGHVHKFVHSINRVVDTEYSNDFNVIKGISTCMMVVVHGSVGDSTQGPNLGTVTLTPAKLVCITRMHAVARAVNHIPRHVQQSNSLSTVLPSVLAIDEASGLVVDALTAANYS